MFSGDLGRPAHPLLQPPEPIGDADWIVVEYLRRSAARHPGKHPRLEDVISRTVARGGTVVIPAFAVDRTDIILHHLDGMAAEGRLPDVPIHVDSPMALAALRVYRAAARATSPELRDGVPLDPTPFLADRLHEVQDAQASKRLSGSREPKVIISASGMATGGRVVHHLAAFLPDERSSVVLVGYQASGTCGQALLAGAREPGHPRALRAGPGTGGEPAGIQRPRGCGRDPGLAAHGERHPRGVYLVHGEPAAAERLADRIDDELGWTAVVPRMEELVRL